MKKNNNATFSKNIYIKKFRINLQQTYTCPANAVYNRLLNRGGFDLKNSLKSRLASKKVSSVYMMCSDRPLEFSMINIEIFRATSKHYEPAH